MDLSPITDYLFIASLPKREHASTIQAQGITLILNMIYHRPAPVFNQPPLKTQSLSTLDFPLYPIPLSLLDQGVTSAVQALRQDRKVLVYCKAGRHRSVAMAACILISQGFSAHDALALIKTKRPQADPYAWHIKRRIQIFESVWQSRSG